MRVWKEWTDDDLAFLECYASKMTDKEIAVALGRSVNSVRIKICKLNAEREDKIITCQEAKAVAPKMANPDAWAGCDEDCFNCKYSDCKMPSRIAPIGMQYSEEGIQEMIKR